jgi:hypothetical protein
LDFDGHRIFILSERPLREDLGRARCSGSVETDAASRKRFRRKHELLGRRDIQLLFSQDAD